MTLEPKNNYEYLAISENDLLWDLYITGIGTDIIPPNAAYPPDGHPGIYSFSWQKGRVLPEYQLLVISQGSGMFESIETGEIHFDAPAAIILLPGIWHRYRPHTATGWTEHWLSLNGEFLYRLSRRNVISAAEAFYPDCNVQKIMEIHNNIWQQLQNSPQKNTPVLTAYGMEALAHTVQSKSPDNTTPLHDTHATDPVVAQALHIIWSHSHRNISVNEIVNQLPVTRRTLERKFNEHLGHCIGRELLICRLTRAKHMLSSTSLPIEHIALATGFSGADRLGKTLRQLENTTPSQYRKKNQ